MNALKVSELEVVRVLTGIARGEHPLHIEQLVDQTEIRALCFRACGWEIVVQTRGQEAHRVAAAIAPDGRNGLDHEWGVNPISLLLLPDLRLLEHQLANLQHVLPLEQRSCA